MGEMMRNYKLICKSCKREVKLGLCYLLYETEDFLVFQCHNCDEVFSIRKVSWEEKRKK